MTRATPDHSCLLAALMTPRGRGAVATIAIRGEPARHGGELASMFRAANGRTVPEQPFGRIVFGQWGRDSAEDVVLCRIDAQTLEIHCHGGETAAQRILEDWRALGAEIISWEAMLRATSDVLEAEFQVCLSRATTWQTTESLLRQAEGRLRQAFEALQTAEWSVAGRQAIQSRIRDLLRWSKFGLHLSQPWKVVLTGRPNVGKSSLINALLGYERSIVFNQPGTTRDVVTALTAFDGWPVELSDTPGLRSDAENLEAAGIELAQQQLAAADLVVVVEDGPGSGERESVTREVSSRFRRAPLLVANKDDIPGVWQNKFPEGAIRVSAKTGTGLNDLQQAIVRELVPEIPAEGVAVPVTERQIELLRRAQFASEQGDEVGYHAAVSALLEC